MNIINSARATDVTKTVHTEPYDAISPENPKLSQAGKTILITGGGTTIGNAIGRSFVRSSAETVIIIGRRPEVLQEGARRLEQEAKTTGTHTKIIHRQLDIGDFSAFLVNVSSTITHSYMQPATTKHAAYAFQKSCGTMLFQMVAKDTPVDEMQIASMHPGLLWQEEWVKMGFKDDVGFDNIALLGNFAVWLATPNAAFLHGRFAWASWDVNELSEGPLRKRIDEDPYYLKMTLVLSSVKDEIYYYQSFIFAMVHCNFQRPCQSLNMRSPGFIKHQLDNHDHTGWPRLFHNRTLGIIAATAKKTKSTWNGDYLLADGTIWHSEVRLPRKPSYESYCVVSIS
ncbi:unnamed protein product [Fusarium graminearum]|nr:unnamed protein product [Fusarium graminearum]